MEKNVFKAVLEKYCPLFITLQERLEAALPLMKTEHLCHTHLGVMVFWNSKVGQLIGDGDLKNWMYRYIEHSSMFDLPDQTQLDDAIDILYDGLFETQEEKRANKVDFNGAAYVYCKPALEGQEVVYRSNESFATFWKLNHGIDVPEKPENEAWQKLEFRSFIFLSVLSSIEADIESVSQLQIIFKSYLSNTCFYDNFHPKEARVILRDVMEREANREIIKPQKQICNDSTCSN